MFKKEIPWISFAYSNERKIRPKIGEPVLLWHKEIGLEMILANYLGDGQWKLDNMNFSEEVISEYHSHWCQVTSPKRLKDV